MRILQLGGLAGPGPVAGGVWRVASTQTDILRAMGHDVELFGLWLGDEPESSPTASPHTHFLASHPPFPGAGLRGLVTPDLESQLLAAGPYDVAHVHLARDYFTTRSVRILKKLGIPFVVQTHGMVRPPEKLSTKTFDAIFKRTVIGAPDRWLALTKQERDDLSAYGADRIVDIPNPVLPSSKVWKPDDARYLLFASRLHPRKQADVLVRAVDALIPELPDIRLIIAGPDEGGLDAVQESVARSSDPSRFQIIGPQDQAEVRHLLAHAWAMVLPSRAEVAPMIAIEACEMGTPMVLTEDCGLVEGLIESDLTEVVSAPTEAGVAAAVRKIWTNPALAQEISERERLHYAKNWSPEIVGRRLVEIYDEIAKPFGNQGSIMNRESGKLPISVLVQTKNEALGIRACVESLSDFDEVIVADSGSMDGTQAIAESAGARVVNFAWNGSYPKKKEWMLRHAGAKHDWVLIIDADERVTSDLVDELWRRQGEMSEGTVAAYEVPIDYVFDGRLLRHGHKVYKRTIMDRTRTTYPRVDDLGAPGMGELEGHYQPVVTGKIEKTDSAILHDDKDPIRSWFDRHNRYSDWEAYLVTHPDVKRQADAARTANGQLFARVPFKPLAFFVYDYVVRQGFRDGREGFNYAFALSWYYWLTDVKVREAQRAPVADDH